MKISRIRSRTEIFLFLSLILLLWGQPVSGEDELSYPEAGLTFSGLLVQPTFGWWFGRAGIRAGGMFYGSDNYRYFFNLAWAFFDKPNLQQSVNILTSHTVGSDPGADYDFWSTGIAYGINFYGFFLELGIGIPWRDNLGNVKDDPVVPCGCLGYLYQFRTDK